MASELGAGSCVPFYLCAPSPILAWFCSGPSEASSGSERHMLPWLIPAFMSPSSLKAVGLHFVLESPMGCGFRIEIPARVACSGGCLDMNGI